MNYGERYFGLFDEYDNLLETLAVIWADSVGVVNGMSETAFAPGALATREQLAVILYRYARYKGLDTSAAAELDPYEDADQVHGWAMEAVKWACAEGLMDGRSQTQLVPRGRATRAEAATLLMRFRETVVK